jgi:hypothetical protein
MIDRTPKGEIEYFTTAKEIALEDDRIELDIHVIGWSKKFRIRALSFGQMERITRNSRDDKGELDNELWSYWTLVEGVVLPNIRIADAKELADNNGAFIRELVDEIWQLGRISRKQWDDYIAEQTRLTEAESKNAD